MLNSMFSHSAASDQHFSTSCNYAGTTNAGKMQKPVAESVSHCDVVIGRRFARKPDHASPRWSCHIFFPGITWFGQTLKASSTVLVSIFGLHFNYCTYSCYSYTLK